MKRFLLLVAMMLTVLFLAGCTIHYDHLIPEEEPEPYVEPEQEVASTVITEEHPDYIDRDTAVEHGIDLEQVPQEELRLDINNPNLSESNGGITGNYYIGDYIVGLDGVQLVGLIENSRRYYHIQFNYDGITYTYPYDVGSVMKVQGKWVSINKRYTGGREVSLTVKD